MSWEGILLSIQLFSSLPIQKSINMNSRHLCHALLFLPILWGLLGALIAWLSRPFYQISSFLGAGVTYVLYLILSGGLHLDGLSDMADGFLSGKNRQKTLKIMKDPALGMYGSLSLLAYTVLKLALLTCLTPNYLLGIAVMNSLSRLSVLYVIARGPGAGSSGFGRMMEEALSGRRKTLLIYAILFLSLLALLSWKLLVLSLFLVLVAECIRRWSVRKIGGVNGDIYGATIEVNEIVALLLLVVMMN